jgi:hypothetical protein
MTPNLAEVYNQVIRGLRGLPLIAIIEGMLYGIIKYYQKRHCRYIQTGVPPARVSRPLAYHHT